MTRWIAVSERLLHGRHKWHPHSTGETACKAFAWVDLIGLAAWRDEGGLERGQARASQRYLAARWNWSRGKVARFLEELEREGAIRRGAGMSREPDRITICNYDTYQSPWSASGSAGGATDGATDRAKEVPVPEPAPSSVLSEPAAPTVENSRWNDRLAPVARDLGGEKHVGNWLRTAKKNPDYFERVMLGLVSMRERGAVICLKPGDWCTPAVLHVPVDGQPLERRAEAEYWRITSPPRADRGPERLKVENGGMA